MNITGIVMITFVIGVFSNVLGGIIGYHRNKESNNYIEPFTAGITTAIICFELLMEAFEIGTKIYVVVFVILGVILCLILNSLVKISNVSKKSTDFTVITSIMSTHNITEGMAIGAAFRISKYLGMSLLLSVAIHNIPEGMIIGNIVKREESKKINILKSCTIIGVFLALGAVIGGVAGSFNRSYVMPSLAVSAGAMLYIVACELIPEMSNYASNKKVGMIYIFGFLLGSLICNI